MKKEIITIAGDLGSGKSTTADLVAETLGYDRFSSGSIMRKMAEERNISIGEMNTLAESEPDIDHEIDTTIQSVGKEKNRLVIDSRTAWHWIPASFKVYLSLDSHLAAERIFKSIASNNRKTEGSVSSVIDVKEKTRNRAESERKRFIERYGIDPRDTSKFDLVIDTSTTPPKAVAKKLIDAYNKWLKEEKLEE